MQRSTTMLAAEKRQSTPKKFDFRSFMKLISTIHPHYWQLGLGLLLGLVATAGQLIVPTIAKSLINALGHAVNMNLVIGVVGLFIGSALISAGSGAVLGFLAKMSLPNYAISCGPSFWYYQSVISTPPSLAKSHRDW